ncbi:MAG: TonB-dependent receptor plug domain-containing protein [Sphingobacteriaceae bacterium]|nr:TonB-dependent receptor plug domain-containing protein [Sphingobacteriaceae bacterium]
MANKRLLFFLMGLMVVLGFAMKPVTVTNHPHQNYDTTIQDSTKSTSKADKNAPLCVLEGKVISKSELDKINPDAIESINVLKGKNAVNTYGKAGKNGVIQITLKK